MSQVVEIVDIDSSSGEESSSSSSDSDDCIMLSDSEVPPSPEAEEDPNNSGKPIYFLIDYQLLATTYNEKNSDSGKY